MRELISKFIRKEYSIHQLYTWLRALQLKILRRKILHNYLKKNEIKKLQLGCGKNEIKGWLNTDIYPLNKRIAYIDVAEKFPFENESFDYVFSEHLFEHLNFEIATNYLEESFRILKKGSRIRIAMPNIYFLLSIIENPKLELHQRYIDFTVNNVLPHLKKRFPTATSDQLGTFVVNNFFKDWDHQIIYDFKTIELMLSRAGFSKIQQVEIGDSNDKNLEGIERHGMIIPNEFNILETMVVQAEKL